jgi:hypothetical protein
MIYQGVSRPITETGPDGTITILPVEVWTELLKNSRSTVIRDLLMWEAEMRQADQPAMPLRKYRRTVTGTPTRRKKNT